LQKPASIELGPYQLLERIGEGGSGQVYRARGPSGPVAIKLLGPASDMDDAARARFRREIAALGQLAHPHLVSMIDHGVDAELGPYLVLPLLAGTTLRELVGARALCPEAALLLAQPIVAATAALHAAGYVHRDLKPENAIAGPDGSLTVIDLGLAWREGMTRHTDTGAAVGSVGYMAPEQIEGRTVDTRADVWALGVMVYEWIAGKRPFQRARPAEEAAAMLLGQFSRLTAADRRADDALAELVARCLRTEPAERPTAAELANAIDAMIDWTDDVASERAAVIADPAGYQARVASFRVRRMERLAREAIDAGKPFAALAYCDRGLAYAPDHAQLLALVAEAEKATAGARPPPNTPAHLVVTAPARPSALASGDGATASNAGASPTTSSTISSDNAVRTSSRAPIAGAAASQPARTRRAKWPYLVGALVVLWFAAIAIYVVVPDRAPPEPAPAPSLQVETSSMDPQDRALANGIVNLFGRALDRMPDHTPPAKYVTPPTTASGWLELAATQPPAEAVASIRQALALSPTWLDAQMALCAALAATKDRGALAACEVALRRKPDDVALLAAHGAALLEAGDAKAALVELDRVVAADPDPKWRRLRARARTAAGDSAGAQQDLQNACQLGDAAACSDKP
jgi:tetratricopeptide (TPR) repeat protein